MRRFILVLGTLVMVYLLVLNIIISDVYRRSPDVQAGTLELTRDDLAEHNHALWIHGEWEWYPNRFLTMDDLPHTAPHYIKGAAPWPSFDDTPGSFGFGTYRLHVVVPSPGRYSLFVPWVNTAYRLYVDGELKIAVGNPGTHPGNHVSQYRPTQTSITIPERTFDMLIHVGNFSHPLGGLVKPILFGSQPHTTSIVTLQHATNTFIIAAMLVVASIVLMFYGKSHRETRLLYIAGIAVILALRTMLSTSMLIYRIFPDLPWELGLRVEYITVPMAAFCFLGFFKHTYPGLFSLPVVYAAQIASVVLSLFLLAVPTHLFAVLLVASQVMIAVSVSIWIFQAVRHQLWKTFFDGIITFCTMLFAIGGVLDSLNYLRPMPYYFPMEFSTITMVYFVFCIVYIYTKQFLDTLTYAQQLAQELEEKVQKRTNELEQLSRKLLQMATKDELTGLWNRNELQRRSDDETYRHNRYYNSNNPYFSALYIDLDNFKFFNDSYTHEVGDMVLKEFARVITSSSRKSDSQFRIGGDEFLVFLPKTDGAGAIRIARRILTGVEELNGKFEQIISEREGKTVIIPEGKRLTCSIGIAIHGEGNLHIERLIQYADTALLQAKLAGKNQYHIYQPQDLEEH